MGVEPVTQAPIHNCCPCCGYLTLRERGGFEICPVCFWQDDDVAAGRESHNLVSLVQARQEFKAIGASDLLWTGEVREPTEDEKNVTSGSRKV